MTYDVIHSLSAAINKNKSAQVKTIITTSPVEPVRSTSDITSNKHNLTLRTSSSTSALLEPVPSKVDAKKKAKTPRKHSAPVQPKSGALAAAMMAATVAGGSGILDARKNLQEETSKLRNKKSKATIALEEAEVPIPNSFVSSSSAVNIPSKLADIVTLDTQPAAANRKYRFSLNLNHHV